MQSKERSDTVQNSTQKVIHTYKHICIYSLTILKYKRHGNTVFRTSTDYNFPPVRKSVISASSLSVYRSTQLLLDIELKLV